MEFLEQLMQVIMWVLRTLRLIIIIHNDWHVILHSWRSVIEPQCRNLAHLLVAAMYYPIEDIQTKHFGRFTISFMTMFRTYIIILPWIIRPVLVSIIFLQLRGVSILHVFFIITAIELVVWCLSMSAKKLKEVI
ncbi:hypothetical protein DQQ10_21490 [Pseudochryseolinea flava]|uniref:Uncharacterized protein n=1 Tax=Pseudochryseolinea flava TaxID=2059302 RepID=A0A364XWT4_9BACT|nr:hypothetical protein DQQ10_21490 [Pseudochryseolinea flava]